MIRYLNRNEIDDAKWDQTIHRSSNSLIYAYCFYLDKMSPGWKAIVSGDYEFVMPLCWRRKWGIEYLYQPAFTQQGGVFSASAIDEQLIREMIKETQNRFRFAEIFMNFGSSLPGLPVHTNYILSLAPAYESIRTNYKEDLLRNLKSADIYGLVYSVTDQLNSCLDNFRTAYSSRLRHISASDYQSFALLCKTAGNECKIIMRIATAESAGGIPNAGDILASALLLEKNNRMYLLQSYVSGLGRKMSANHFLLDRLVLEFSGTSMLLDFEGSDVKGIADFYENFGPVNQPYFYLQFNDLPFLPRKLKHYKDSL